MTEYFIQKESTKVIETLTLAGATDETNLDEGWDGKIPAVCSTPKMTSLIGREIQEEYRRNSLSKKRKCSPEENKEKNQKTKPNTPGGQEEEGANEDEKKKNS